jgi:hypothetical protein
MGIEGSYHGKSNLYFGQIRTELELDLPPKSRLGAFEKWYSAGLPGGPMIFSIFGDSRPWMCWINPKIIAQR